jgi:amino acid efflux transporter
LASSLASNGFAPSLLSLKSKKYNTPLGGLLFLSICFGVLLLVFSTQVVSLSTLIQIPSGTFILTYVGGCIAGVILLKNNRFGLIISVVSLILTVTIFLFVTWAILYPLIITVCWSLFMFLSKKSVGMFKFQNREPKEDRIN